MSYLKLNQAKEKYSNYDGREIGIRKIFEVVINNSMCPVYSIEGYEHESGRRNGDPTEWWVDISDPVSPNQFGDTETVSPNESELVPYSDKCFNRICWGVDYKQKNYSKEKWGETRLNGTGVCNISANGKNVYKFISSDLGHALGKAQYIINALREHPYDFINPDSENGRKIYYHGLPATIRTAYQPGDITVVPDFSYIGEPEWWRLYNERSKLIKDKPDRDDEDEEYDNRPVDFINHGDVLWDGMINWFRE